MLRVGKHTAVPSSIGARSWFSGAERDFLTESESPWVADAASSGSREEELVERNASAALKTAGTSRRGEAEVWSLPTSIGARSWFSRAERDFLTESESPWVADAAPSWSRKEELVERNASVALKTAVTEIRVHEQHKRLGAGARTGPCTF